MTINLSAWQTRVLDDSNRYVVVNCGRRAGKTYLVALKMIDFVSSQPKHTVWYVAPDYKQAKQIMWQMLKELLPKQLIEKTNDTELKILLKNGSQILLKGAQDPDTLRGVRIDFCVFDECAFIDSWENVWKVIRPTLVDSKADVWFISTPNGFNHFKTLAESTDPEFSYHHYTSYDNPYLDAVELDKARADMDDDSFQQEFMGEFRKMKGLIYKDFYREVHMTNTPDITNWTKFRSLDFGFGHKAALGYFAVSPTGDEVHMYDGLYQSGMTHQDLADATKIKDGGKFITNAWADSEDPTGIEVLQRASLYFQAIHKGPDSVVEGIRKVASLLKIRADTGRPTLTFNKNLAWVADEFEKYRWIESKSDNTGQREAPLKREDDAMDMIRYFAMGYDHPITEGPRIKQKRTKIWGENGRLIGYR